MTTDLCVGCSHGHHEEALAGASCACVCHGSGIPAGWREITSSMLIEEMPYFHQRPTLVQLRYLRDKDGGYRNTVLHLFADGTGVGIQRRGRMLAFFRFGCVHVYVGDKCSKCGHVRVIPHDTRGD